MVVVLQCGGSLPVGERGGCLAIVVLAVGGRGWMVVGGWLQLGDVADALGHALAEQQLGPHLQVLRVLDELEAHHRLLARPQLLL